jgi:signal peptidase I
VTVLVAAVVLMLLVKAFFVQVYRIPSPSMEDTLLTGDRVLVNKLVYHFRGIDRGDIVVFSGQGSWGSVSGAPIPPPSSDPVVRVVDDVLSDIGLYPGFRS